MSLDVKTLAGEVGTGLDFVLSEMPFFSTLIALIPGGSGVGAAMAAPLIKAVLTGVDQAAKAVAAGDNSGAFDVTATLIKHLLPGLPNATALTPTVSDPTPTGQTA